MNKLDLYENLGNQLIKSGREFKKKVFDINKNNIYTIEKPQIINLLKSLGFYNFAFADRKYYYLDLGVMRGIIANDWTDKREYLVERFDCDKFAQAFKSHMSEIYLINGVALAKHIKVTLSNGEKVYHRAVIFLAKDKGMVGLYLLESQNDLLTKITSSDIVTLGKWDYLLGLVEF